MLLPILLETHFVHNMKVFQNPRRTKGRQYQTVNL